MEYLSFSNPSLRNSVSTGQLHHEAPGIGRIKGGVMSLLVILILGRYFGRKSFGSILGTAVALLAPMGLLDAVFYRWIFDTTGSCNNAFVMALILSLLAYITMFFVHVLGVATCNTNHMQM